ncbi:uncharacterized protein ACB058_014803 [Synchiropus picturatus]
MDPPTYEEARLHPPVSGRPADIVSPPPSYDASLCPPPTPPPSYGEAVTQNPFPILTPPQVHTTVTSAQSPATRVNIHPTTFIDNRSGTELRHLRNVPAVVRCPYCDEMVTSKVVFRPGMEAWLVCCILAASGLICGFCLIPFCTKCSQDTHHLCPNCGKLIYRHKNL